METYDIYFKDAHETANKGFNIKDREKAVRMANDMLTSRKGFVKQFPGGVISVKCKESGDVIWESAIPETE